MASTGRDRPTWRRRWRGSPRAGPFAPEPARIRRGARTNLIVVQVESLQDFVVDYRVGGQEVMPHLRRWTDDSLRFTNVTDQTSEGRTSDAEFASPAAAAAARPWRGGVPLSRQSLRRPAARADRARVTRRCRRCRSNRGSGIAA